MALSGAQLAILKSNIEGAELGAYRIEQVHFLAGGNISQDELTIVTEVPVDGKVIRYADSYDVDGRTNRIAEAEVKQ